MFDDIISEDNFKEKLNNYIKYVFEDVISIMTVQIEDSEEKAMVGKFFKEFLVNDFDEYIKLYTEFFTKEELKESIGKYDRESVKKAVDFTVNKSNPFLEDKLISFFKREEVKELLKDERNEQRLDNSELGKSDEWSV